jgi:hypothetical protein
MWESLSVKWGQNGLLELLREQLGFLDASCDGYDNGSIAEAKRLATTVRVLIHDTPASHSLMYQLKLKEQTMFRDLLPIGAQLAAKNNAPAVAVNDARFGYALAGVLENDIEWIPAYRANYPPLQIITDFSDWWSTPHMSDTTGHLWSRRNFILMLANKEGGAHVDDLPNPWADLVHRGGSGWRTSDGKPILRSPAPAAARHIAEELRRTIRASHPHLLGAQADPPPDSYTPNPRIRHITGTGVYPLGTFPIV